MKRVGIALLTLAVILVVTADNARSRGKTDRPYDQVFERIFPSLSTGVDTIIDPIVNWPTFHGVQQTGEIDAFFNCYGQFGLGFDPSPQQDVPGWPVASFESPPGTGIEYLFGGAIWVGGIVGPDTLVSVGADGWSMAMEMFPPEVPQRGSVTKFDYVADYSMRAEFYDTTTQWISPDYFGQPHIPLNIRMVNRSHAWRSTTESWTVLYDLVITNIGSQPINEGYVGLYFDADVLSISNPGGFTDDITGSIRNLGIGYIIDNDGDLTNSPPSKPCPRIFAFGLQQMSFLSTDTSFNWWVSNGNSALDFGPRERPYMGDWKEPFRDYQTGGIGTPEGDKNKYYIMKCREWDYDQIYTAVIDSTDTLWMYPNQDLAPTLADGIDARFLMSVGPFDLLPDSSVRVLYATFTGDSVHTDPTNLGNLPSDPDSYLANLDFLHLLENAAISDSLNGTLLDPLLPVTGLQIEYKDNDSVVVRWDPWVFADVEGYEIYLYEVSPDSFPYPGVVPPWLEPDVLNPVASLGRSHQYTFDTLSSGMFYLVNVAHRTTTRAVGDPGESLPTWLGDRSEAPVVDKEFVFMYGSDPAILQWAVPAKTLVDHYNIYRFPSDSAAAVKFHAFYDEGFHAQTMPPKDTFLVDGRHYYYYAMDVYTQVPSSVTSFTDFSAGDEMVYVITAVDNDGFESHFSVDITALQIEPRTKDILVVTNSKASGIQFTVQDSVHAFYDSILYGYDYDIYSYDDSTPPADWHDFMPYRLLVVDDRINALDFAYYEYEGKTGGLTKYLLSGGELAYFGSLRQFQGFNLGGDTAYYNVTSPFVTRFFGIDTIFYVGPSFFHFNGLPMVDTFFAFSRAEATASMPDVSYDTSRYTFTSTAASLWPPGTPLSVSTFGVNAEGETTHLYRALPGVNSMNEGEPVGVRTLVEGIETYLFGFHLWYMTYDEGRALIEALMMPPPKVIIEPDTVYAHQINIIDSLTADIYIGEFSDGHLPGQVIPASVRVNEAVVPISTTVLPSYPDFTGEVLQIEFSQKEFLQGYIPFMDTSLRSFAVTGEFSDGDPLEAYGKVTLIGHTSGDLNGDGSVDVSDLAYLIGYLFGDGPPPVVDGAADVDDTCDVNVGDVTYLVAYLFAGGPQPVSCFW
ncbi:MAG: dockerin type I domain-containing protein [bacterium]